MKIENYVSNKQRYDQHYMGQQSKMTGGFEFNWLLEIYLKSNIKLDSLKEAHHNHEHDKQTKLA